MFASPAGRFRDSTEVQKAHMAVVGGLVQIKELQRRRGEPGQRRRQHRRLQRPLRRLQRGRRQRQRAMRYSERTSQLCYLHPNNLWLG